MNNNSEAPPISSEPQFKSYKIEHVRDLLQIPPERIDACLDELKDYLAVARIVLAAAKVLEEAHDVKIKPEDVSVGGFEWTDDGLREGAVRFIPKWVK